MVKARNSYEQMCDYLHNTVYADRKFVPLTKIKSSENYAFKFCAF